MFIKWYNSASTQLRNFTSFRKNLPPLLREETLLRRENSIEDNKKFDRSCNSPPEINWKKRKSWKSFLLEFEVRSSSTSCLQVVQCIGSVVILGGISREEKSWRCTACTGGNFFLCSITRFCNRPHTRLQLQNRRSF